MYFGVLGFLIIAVQVFFAVDAYKKGRYYWVWIIFFFSMIACLVYFFVEYLPDLQASRLSEKISSNLEKIIAPEKELKRLKEQLEFCDNVENRTALAEAYMTNHQFSEAIPLLEACLQGHYRDDEYLIEKLSFAYFMTKAYAKTKERLFQLRKIQGGGFTSQEAHLLLAVTYEYNEEMDEALKEYEEVVKRYTGEEANCRYGSLLKRLGRVEEAKEIFKKIIQHSKISPKFYQTEQAKWIEKAKKELSS